MVNLFVRLLSTRLWCCIEINAHVIKLFSPSGRGNTSFLSLTAVTKFQKENSLAVHKQYEIGHGYYGSLTGSHRSIRVGSSDLQ